MPQPITVSDVLAYCELMGIRSQFERDLLYKLTSRLDRAFLEHAVKRQTAK